MIRCLECMEEYEEGLRQCPYCGAGQVWMQEEKNYLSPGIKLQNRYIAGTVQAKRETDIIYIGWDTIFERKVLIQEFFPDYCVSRSDGKGVSIFTAQTRTELFDKGLETFAGNARKLMHLYMEPDIAQVYSCFQENNTAYMVSEYHDLPVLRDYAEGKNLKPQERKALMKAAMQTVEKLQQNGIVHGNISEDSFWVTPENALILRTPESARCICGHLDSLDYGTPGPWTDIYGLSAALFYLAAGKTYEEGADFSKMRCRLRPNEKKAIKNGLEKAVHYRTKDIQNFELEFWGNAKGKRSKTPKRKDKKILRQLIFGTAALSIAMITGIVVFQINDRKIGPQFLNQTEQNQVRVPNLVNLDVETAEKTCREFGLILETAEEKIYDDAIPAGIIIGQNPEVWDESSISLGSKIVVTVSGGPPPEETQAETKPPKETQAETKPPEETQAETKPPEETQAETKPPKETQAETKSPEETQAETKPQEETQPETGGEEKQESSLTGETGTVPSKESVLPEPGGSVPLSPVPIESMPSAPVEEQPSPSAPEIAAV